MTDTNYTRPVELPTTKQDGLANALQMAINLIERGEHKEAVFMLVDTLDDVRSNANPYLIGKAPKRKAKPSDDYRGTVNVD